MAPVLRQRSPSRPFEEVADLAEAPAADAGLLLDEGPRLLGGADRVLEEVFLQRVLVLGQGAVGVRANASNLQVLDRQELRNSVTSYTKLQPLVPQQLANLVR